VKDILKIFILNMLLGLEDYFYLKGNVAEQKVNDKKVYNSAHSVQDA
jgi:hypothetical protein